MTVVVPRSACPDARPDISPDVLLVPLPPYEAYAADVDRLNGRAPFGAVDDAWLLLAHTLARAATLPRAQRAALCLAGARTMEAVLPRRAPTGGDERPLGALGAAVEALGALATLLNSTAPAPDAGRLHAAVGALQTVIAQQEQAGAFLLAFSMLAAVRGVLRPVLDARCRGLLLAQQGRVARQLGAFATASHLYRSAIRAAKTAAAPDVTASALLGAGALASMRGNYPEARTCYRRALRMATRARSAFLERASHHGLLIAAFAAEDLDVALSHGWAAFRALPDDAIDERAETLINLAEVGRQAGAHRAALAACLSAIELTNLPRLRLPALGTAVRLAVTLSEHRLVEFLARDTERTVERSGQAFENARALVELAEAFDGFRNDMALRYAARAQTLAVAGQFHEVAARAERVIAGTVAGPDVPGSPETAVVQSRSPRARAILRTLGTLPALRRYQELAAC